VVVVVVVVVVVALVVVLIRLSPNPPRMIDWNMEATSTEGGSLILVTGEFITLRRMGRPVTTRLTERESENILSRAASVVLLMAGLVDLVVDMVVVVVCVFSCIEIRLEMMCPMEEASFWVCCSLSVCKGLSTSFSFSSVGFNSTFIFSSTSSFDGFFFFLFFFCGFWVLIFGDSGGSSVFLLTLTCCTCTECGRPFAGNCIEVARLQTFES